MAQEDARRSRKENEIEFARIVAFSDGVFAIAITLLVLNLNVKTGLLDSEVAGEILNLWDNFLAFGISFAVIGRFWIVHHRFFGEVTGFDGRLLGLNLLYLACIVLVPFSSQVLGEYGDSTAGVVVYAVNLAAAVLVGALMARYATRAALTREGDAVGRETHIRSLFTAAVFLFSIPVAFVSPTVAPFFWLLLFFDPSGRIARRRNR